MARGLFFFAVFHRKQKKSLRRSGWTGGCAGACGEYTGDRIRVETPPSHVQHSSHQVADHVVQKAVPSHAIDQQIPGVTLLLRPG